MTGSLPQFAQESAGQPAAVAGHFDSAPALAYASALFILGSLSTLITPALLQGWADQYRWPEARLGWIAMIELAGLALGSLSAFFWQRRYNWRRIAGWAMVVIIVANAVCGLTSIFSVLCGFRFVSGVAGGVLMGVFTAFLSNTRAPEKFLAATTLIQILTQAALISLSSVLLDRWGMKGVYAMLGGVIAILLPGLRLLPVGWPREPAVRDATMATDAPIRATKRSRVAGILMLAAFVPFEIFQGGTYSFLQEFGARGANLQSAQNLHVMGLSAIGSGLGPIAAYFLADRAGELIPLAGSILAMLAFMAALTSAPYSAMALLLMLSLLQATWLFAICYYYAGLIRINNVLTQAASPLSAIGLAAGASVMGSAIEWNGLTGIFRVSLLCLLLTAAAALPPLYAAERAR